MLPSWRSSRQRRASSPKSCAIASVLSRMTSCASAPKTSTSVRRRPSLRCVRTSSASVSRLIRLIKKRHANASTSRTPSRSSSSAVRRSVRRPPASHVPCVVIARCRATGVSWSSSVSLIRAGSSEESITSCRRHCVMSREPSSRREIAVVDFVPTSSSATPIGVPSSSTARSASLPMHAMSPLRQTQSVTKHSRSTSSAYASISMSSQASATKNTPRARRTSSCSSSPTSRPTP